MGILDGAVKGAMSGLADFGESYMKQGFQEDRDERAISARKELQEDASRLAEERAKNLAEFKLELSEKVRTQTLNNLRQGVASSSGIDEQFGAARDAYANSSGYTIDENGNKIPIDMNAAMGAVDSARDGAINRAMTDPKAIQAGALASGEFDVAKAVDGMGNQKFHNAPFGSTVLSEADGSVVYDGSVNAKMELEREKMASKGGTGGIIDTEKSQASIDKVDASARKKAEALTKDKKHPYAGEEDIDDVKMESALGDAMSETLLAARKRGITVNTHELGTTLKTRFEELDKVHKKVIEARASTLFDEGGMLKNPANAEQLTQAGLEPSNVDAFKRSYRDQMLTLEKLKEYRTDPIAYVKTMDELIESSKPKAEQKEDRKLKPNKDGIIEKQGFFSRFLFGKKEAPADWEPGQTHSGQSDSGKIKY